MDILSAVPISSEDIVLQSLEKNGICLVNNLISDKCLYNLSSHSISVFNSSNTAKRNGYIKAGPHKFLSHTLLAPNAISIYTNPNLICIANSYTKSLCHLSNHRIYQNLFTNRLFSKPMHWHKDNKLDYIGPNGKHDTRVVHDDFGLILIMYLTDVVFGGTQFALGSQYYKNEQESFDDSDLLDFPIYTANNLPAGTGILYDYRIIHRAQPVYNKNHSRVSLFAQMSSRSMPKGEPIAIHSDVLFALNSDQRYFLNFSDGLSTSPNWPLDYPNSTLSRIKSKFSRILPL